MVVVIFHFMEFAVPDYSKSFVGHGFLAVDFFFCLSGFVIGYAYDDRIRELGIAAFLKSRLIRLHPMVVLGSILGLLALFLDPFARHLPVIGAGKLSLVFFASVLVIPLPILPERLLNLFSLNAPSWSLFWEYVASVAYAVFLYRIGRRSLLLFTALAAAALCMTAYRAGSLMGGWGGPTFFDGAARVAYSFAAGLLVYRSKWMFKTRLGFAGLSVLLLAALMMPYFKWNWLVELLIVLFYLPFLVVLGAGTTLTKRSEDLCTFSGNISYPLYMIHYAVIWAFASYLSSRKPGTLEWSLVVATSVVLLVGLAYVVLILYDLPLRRYLGSKRSPVVPQPSQYSGG